MDKDKSDSRVNEKMVKRAIVVEQKLDGLNVG